MQHDPKSVAYIRVSTEEQARGGISLDMQEERLKAYCKLASLELEAVEREEGCSGFIPLADRPAGRRLVRMVQEGTAHHVIALKLDRLFRNAEDALRQTRLWDAKGVALHIADLGGTAMNTSGAAGRMFLTLMAGFAEFERGLISERTAAAIQHKRSHLQVYGSVPFGFDRFGNRLRPNQEELETIARIRQMRAEGRTLGDIARALNTEHIPTKRGREWHASTIRYLLANRLYAEAI